MVRWIKCTYISLQLLGQKLNYQKYPYMPYTYIFSEHWVMNDNELTSVSVAKEMLVGNGTDLLPVVVDLFREFCDEAHGWENTLQFLGHKKHIKGNDLLLLSSHCRNNKLPSGTGVLRLLMRDEDVLLWIIARHLILLRHLTLCFTHILPAISKFQKSIYYEYRDSWVKCTPSITVYEAFYVVVAHRPVEWYGCRVVCQTWGL